MQSKFFLLAILIFSLSLSFCGGKKDNREADEKDASPKDVVDDSDDDDNDDDNDADTKDAGGGDKDADTPDIPDPGDAEKPDTDDDDDTDDAFGRSDPEKFPNVCIESCADACQKLGECEAFGAERPLYDEEECNLQCNLAMKGLWNDVSRNFRCCASQPNCDEIKKCGGWLYLEEAGEPCEEVCECMSMWFISDSRFIPKGYRPSTKYAVVEKGLRSVDFKGEYGLNDGAAGKYALLSVADKTKSGFKEKLLSREKVLPTFIDGYGRPAALSGGILIKAEDGAQVGAIAAGLGLPVPKKLRYGEDLYYIENDDAALALKALEKLQSSEGIIAEPDMIRFYKRRYTPNDPKFGEQWHLKNDGQPGAIAGIDSRVSEAWDITRGSGDVVIAINDDGVDIKHPDLEANSLSPYNYPEDWEWDLGYGYFGFGWHGTACAGVAAAIADNSEGGAGVCPNCKILPSLSHGAEGYEYDPNSIFGAPDSLIAEILAGLVDAGAWIISNSWGPADGNPIVEGEGFDAGKIPEIIRAAFEHAETKGRNGKGTLVFFAAGNGNESISFDPLASYETNVAVGATDDQGLKSYYSDYGKELDVSAPSNGGWNGIVTTAARTAYDEPADYWDNFGGTSSACPFAAGVAGLVLSANPELTAAQAREILYKSAMKIDPIGGKWDENGFSPFYGYGLLNAYTAVKMAKGECAEAAECPAPSDKCEGDCQRKACGECRNTTFCAEGFVCQPVTSIGKTMCVGKKEGSCAEGFIERNGYCLPTLEVCGFCKDAEACNGRDDDCNGLVDDGLTDCGYDEESEAQKCIMGNGGCAEGEICVGGNCESSCQTDADCEDEIPCVKTKERYGSLSETEKICQYQFGDFDCMPICEVAASSMKDGDFIQFNDCVMEEGKTCDDIMYMCINNLPL